MNKTSQMNLYIKTLEKEIMDLRHDLHSVRSEITDRVIRFAIKNRENTIEEIKEKYNL